MYNISLFVHGIHDNDVAVVLKLISEYDMANVSQNTTIILLFLMLTLHLL